MIFILCAAEHLLITYFFNLTQTALQIWFIKETYFLFWQKLQTFLHNLLKNRLKLTCWFVTDFENFFLCRLPPALSSPLNTQLVHESFFSQSWDSFWHYACCTQPIKRKTERLNLCQQVTISCALAKYLIMLKLDAGPSHMALCWHCKMRFLKVRVSDFHILLLLFFFWEFGSFY